MLGDRDLQALDDLYAKLVWISDGELDRLDDATRVYRQIVGAPDPPPSADGAAGAGEGGGPARPAGSDADDRDGEEADDGAAPGSLADALEQALASARSGQLEQLDEDVELGQVLKDAARGQSDRRRGRGGGTGLPTGRLPDRGVDRPPYADEVQHARRYATRLRQAYALGPIAWILTDGLRQIGGRCATALFGNGAELLADGTVPLPRVPGIRTGGGTAFAGDAIERKSIQHDR